MFSLHPLYKLPPSAIVSENVVLGLCYFSSVYLRIPCSHSILEVFAFLHSLYSLRSKNHFPVSSNNPCKARLWGARYSLIVIQLNTASRVLATSSISSIIIIAHAFIARIAYLRQLYNKPGWALPGHQGVSLVAYDYVQFQLETLQTRTRFSLCHILIATSPGAYRSAERGRVLSLVAAHDI